MGTGIGIYIGRKEVAAASLTKTKGVPQLDEFAIEPFELEDSQAAPSAEKRKRPGSSDLAPEVQAIERALSKLKIRKPQVIASFDPFQLVTRYFRIPLIPKKEQPDTFRFEARRYVPFKLEETIHDFHARTLKHGGVEELFVTISAVKKEALRSCVDSLRKGSAKVNMVEPAFSAFARALAVGERFDEGRIYGFILIDSSGSVHVTLAEKGIVYLSRDFLLSENQLDNQTRFFHEMKASFDFVHQTLQIEQGIKVFLAGSGDVVFWSNFLTGVFGEQFSFEPAIFPTRKDIPRNILSSILIPIGLALRALGYESPLGELSLLPPEERLTKPEEIRKTVGIEFLMVAFAFIALRLLILEPYALWVRNQSVRQLSPEAAADGLLAAESVERLKSIQAELQGSTAQLSQFTQSKLAAGPILSLLSKSLTNSMWLDQVSVQAGGKSERAAQRGLFIEGLCYLGNAEREVQEINGFVKVLGDDPALAEKFKTVTLDEVRRDQYQGYELSRFRIVCQ